MKMTVKSVNMWISVMVLMGFWLIAPFIKRDILFDLLNGLCISACMGVILVYYPSVAHRLGTWRWFMLNRLSGPHYFVLCLTGTMIHIIYRCAWNWVWRLLCDVDSFQSSLWVAFNIWFMIVIATTFLLARGLDEGNIPTENWWWVGMVTGAGLALAFTIMAFIEPNAPAWLAGLILPVYPCKL